MGLLSQIGTAIGTGGFSLLADKLGTKGSSVTQVPLRTPEQEAAQKALLAQGMGPATTYGAPMGDFSMTPLENRSQSSLTDLLNSGMPQGYTSGNNAVNDLLTTDKYDPTKPGGAYDMMQGTMDRQIRDATTAAKRTSAYGGNLYSSDAIRTLGDVQAKGAEAKNSQLGNMYQQYIQQKLSAIPQAFSGAQAQEGTALNRVNAGYTAGALPRSLNTAADQAAYQEWVRAQNAKNQALQTSATTSSNFGVPTVTTPGTSGWENLLNIGAKVAPWAMMAMGSPGGGAGMNTAAPVPAQSPWQGAI